MAGLNITRSNYAPHAILIILALWLSGCADEQKTDIPPRAAAPNTFELLVSLTGSGSVTSNPAGIDCGSDCSQLLAAESSITLSATPASGFTFSGWSGDCSGSTTSCAIVMGANRAVTATFTATPPVPPPVQYTLTVSVTGSGSVRSMSPGIICGSDCTENYNDGTSVALTATPSTNQQFSGWINACSGTELTCTVSMTEARNVIAAFAPVPASRFTLTASVTGTGVITSTPAGISCGTYCTEIYDSDQSVILTATAESGFQFSTWGGACSGSGACVVTMSMNRTVTATFIQNSVDVNCTGTWTGSEENTTITAWPYRDCFRTDPIAGGRTRLSANTGGAVAWEQGTGWNGQNALRVRPPDGSPDLSPPDGIPDRIQGYAGLGIHNFHAVRTKRLNIRYLLRYNSNWALYAQGTKWDLAVKYDYTNPSAPVRREGCDRGINATSSDPLNTGRKRFVIHQGVCTAAYNVPHLDGFSTGPNVRENEWISVENEFDLETGWYRIYITTRDGTYNQSLTSEINIGAGTYGAPIEVVPNPYWWGSIDCSTGCFWGWTNDLGTVPRPADTYIWFSHFVMSNTRIGPPAGFVQQGN